MSTTNELGTKPVGALLAKYSIPAVIAMLVNAIYNIVDRIFIGQFAGESALAGLTIAYPIMVITFAFPSLIAEGGAALLAIQFGEDDKKGASKIFGNTLVLGMIIVLVTMIVTAFGLSNIVSFFGGTDVTSPFAVPYLRIIFAGFIFQMYSFILSSAVRTEGQPLLATASMLISAITNIVLDYVFIGIFKWGVEGAAYATITGQFAGFAIVATYYLRKKSAIDLNLSDLKLKAKVVGKIFMVGFATFISTLGVSVSLTLINLRLDLYAGLAGITSMGAISSLYTFFIMPIMGITQGMQPIIGFNHGAKQHDRVKKTLFYGMTFGVVFSVIVFAMLQLFPRAIMSMFLEPSSDTMNMAVNGLRLYMLMLPLLAVNLMGITYFQATEQGRISVGLGLLRQFVFLVPIIMILPSFMGLNGIWISVPIADGLAILITALFLKKEFYHKESKYTLESETKTLKQAIS